MSSPVVIRILFAAAAIAATSGGALAQNPVGQYSTTEGDLNLRRGNGSGWSFEGSYGNDGGRVYLNSGPPRGPGYRLRLSGRWIENLSSVRCDTPFNGSYYWGLMSLDYGSKSIPGDGFVGRWWYCNFAFDDGHAWFGTRRR